MEVLLATAGGKNAFLKRQLEQFGFACTSLSLDGFVQSVSSNLALTSDIVLLDPPAFDERGSDSLEITIRFSQALRNLHRDAAMWDGRRWSALPIACAGALRADDVTNNVLAALNVFELSQDREMMRKQITRSVDNYRKHIAEDFESLGFHVSEHNGVIIVDGLTVQLRRRADSAYYNGSKDQRIGRRFILRRDPGAVANQIDEFMDLISRPGIAEPDLQEFFERNEHFLTLGMKALIPHAYLPFESHPEYSADVPDFILKPRVLTSITRDSDYEVLDIKRPSAKVVIQKGRRTHFSAAITEAMAQLRDYRDYFRDRAHEQEVATRLGRPVKHPKLGVIIGRSPDPDTMAHLDRAQADDLDVQITTYDEILDRQINLLPPN